MEHVYKSTYVECVEEVKKIMASSPVDLDHPKLIIVPEVYTFDFERAFYRVGGGSFDVKVTSFSKLYYDLMPENTAISRQTAIAIVRKAALDNRDKLTYYKSAFDKRGFAAKVYETLEKLSGSNVSPDELVSSDPSLERKMSDLRLIYREYIAATQGKRADSNGRTVALTQYVLGNKTAIDGCDVYVVNFDVFTALQRNLLAAMDKSARKLIVYSSRMQADCAPAKKPSVYAAVTKEDEYSRVADYIADDIFRGIDAEKISVLGENIDYDRIKRVFDSRNIQFYCDKKRALCFCEPADLILRICACKCDGLTADNLIALASNSLVLPDIVQRDAFISYVREHNAFFNAVFDKFEKGEKSALAESARKRVVSFLVPDKDYDVLCAEEFKNIFSSALQNAGKNDVGGEDDELVRSFELTENALDSLVTAFGDKSYRFRELYSAFSEMTRGTEISVVPNKTESVFVGPLNSKRGTACKALYIIGFNDGVLPKIDEGNGLLCDADADKLEREGVTISPLARDANERFRDELIQLVKTAESLHFSYVSDGENKRSYMLRLIENACGMTERDELTKDAIDYMEESAETQMSADDLITYFPTKRACLIRAAKGGNSALYASVLKAVGDDYKKITAEVCEPGDCLKVGIKLKTCSVSMLQTYFECPKKCFYRYTLGAVKPRDGSVKATDVGTLLHKIIERFVRDGNFENAEKVGEAIAEEELKKDETYSLERNARLRRYVKRDAVELCKKVALEFTEGEFSAIGEEINFGGPEEKEERKIAPGGVVLCGQIDRADVWKGNVRVIDYKSGASVELTPNDIYYGKKLQLPIYSLVMKKRGYTPVGMFYFPVNDSDSSGVLTGILADHAEYITAMDRRASERKSDVFEFDPSKKSSKTLVSDDVISAVAEYAVAVSEKAIENIRNGFVAAYPADIGRNGVCSYCDYAQVCPGKKCLRNVRGIKYDDIVRAVKDGTDR